MSIVNHRACALSFVLTSAASLAMAEAPQVVVDIAPLHGMAARVMDGVGTPELLLEPGASPHGYALRPSQARALQNADIVFFNGAGLTPWLSDTLETLSPNATHLELMSVEWTRSLPFRSEDDFEISGPKEGHDDHSGHDDHDEHKHEEHAHEHGHDDEHKHDHGHDHAHDGTDPHGWLDAQNAALWMSEMARVLAEQDPDNAAIYQENATRGIKEIKAAVAKAEERLFRHQSARFIVFHDAYQYFETFFDLQTTAAIALGDAAAPGARHLADIRAVIVEGDIDCIFTEPQYSADLVATVSEGIDVGTAVIDPLGANLAPGPGFYPSLITTMADAMAGCFDASS